MTKKTVLIVGAGITGATIARLLADTNNYNIDVKEQLSTIAGACYDKVSSGAYIQEHGAHIFNTTNKAVWHFVSSFTKWKPFMHKVVGLVNGVYVPLPININSLEKLMSKLDADRLCSIMQSKYAYQTELTLNDLLENEESSLRKLGSVIKEGVFKNYSNKQWGEMPDDSVINRVKAFRFSRDDRYFVTDYQGIPDKGYTEVIKDMLSHKRIKVETNVKASPESFKDYDIVIYTGAVDELCSYELGDLPYRTCKFDTKIYKGRKLQAEAPVVNYPNSYDFTRTHDYSYFMPEYSYGCLAYEYPKAFDKDDTTDVRYYPINKPENIKLYNDYKSLVQKRWPNVVLAGRLGSYKYFSMDKAIEAAMNIAFSLIDLEGDKSND